MNELEFNEKETELLNNLLNAKGANEPIYASLFTLLKFYYDNGSYLKVLDLFKEYESIELSQDEKKSILDLRIGSLLKVEDYNELLKLLSSKDTLSIEGINKSNVLFYKAIAYEALDEVDLSIESLLSIKDDISRYALINKYLKLSLLYVRKNELEKAKEAYDYASMVDFNHKNDIFYLVESDLYFKNENYLEALNSLESFFFKSSNKFKYLDRYIEIMIKLNNLTDAYNFYLRYKDMEQLRLSNVNKYRFLLSARKLLKLLKKDTEVNEIDNVLNRIKPVYYLKEEEDQDKIINNLLLFSINPLSKFDEYKNVIFHFFKLLNGLNLKEMIYVEETEDSFINHEYLGNRLRDREITKLFIRENNLEDYFKFEGDELNAYINFDYKISEETYALITLSNGYDSFGYVLLNGDINQKIKDAIKVALLNTCLRLKALKSSSILGDALLFNISNENKGLIHFMGDKVELLNIRSREIFKTKSVMLNLAYLNNACLTKDFFIGNLSKKSIYTFNLEEEETIISFKLFEYKGEFYSYIEDVTKTDKERIMDEEYLTNSSLSFFNEYYLKDYIENKSDSSYMVMGLYIRIIDEDDTLDSRVTKLDALYNYLSQCAPKSDLFYIGENHFLIINDKTDKRLIESTYSNISRGIAQLYKYTQSLREKEINVFASKALKNKKYEEVEELIEYGFRHSLNKHYLVFLDNDEKREYALYKTYETELIRKLKEEDYKLEFIPVMDKDNYIHYFIPKFSLPYGLSYSIFDEVILKNKLETKKDKVMVEKLFTMMAELNSSLKFIVNISSEAIYNDNFIKNVSILFKKANLKDKIIFEVENIDTVKYTKALNSLRNAGLHLAVRFKGINDLSKIELFDLIFIDFVGDELITSNISKMINESLKKEVILVEKDAIDSALSIKSTNRVYAKEDLLKLNN